MISVNNLTKKFGDNRAVDGISFTVERGEMLGLLGPNGAGKTTTMRIMTGFMPPTEGTVTVDGLDVFEYAFEVKKKIGYMPEHPPLYYDMTSYECLTFVAEVHGLRGKIIDREIERVSELCGITHMLRRLTGHLSKGYRQRVGLAQALIHDPEILVLDEPTAGLDPKQIIEIRELIRTLGRERTVILSSHILPEVTNTCRKIAIIDSGKLVAVDTIESLSNRLSGGRQVVFRVIRPERVDTARLSSINGVKEVAGGRGNEFAMSISGDDRLLEDISISIVGMGAGLLEIKEMKLSLEDIFLKVISGEKTS
jgi:ABC-2 type transport system ATP-binding protein